MQNYNEHAPTIGRMIDDYTSKAYDSGHRNHLGASMIGDPCWRKLWYSFRWAAKENYVTSDGIDNKGRMMRLFNRGHNEEHRFADWLRGCGFKVRLLDPNTEEQIRISGIGGHFGGSADGVISFVGTSLSHLPDMLLEFKTTSDKYFKALQHNGVKKEKPIHFAQMSCYGAALNFKYALYLAINKNTDEIYTEIVQLDFNHALQLLDKAHIIISSKTPPEKLSLNSAYFACKFCSFQEVCHRGKPMEKNCRTCTKSTPIDNAGWFCAAKQLPIPKWVIETGCEQWEQIQ